MSKRRRQVAGGWVEAEMRPMVRVGERMLPARMSARFDPVSGQPAVELDIEVLDGRPQCRRVVVESDPGGFEVRPADLTAIQLDKLVAATGAALALSIEPAGSGSRLAPLSDADIEEADAMLRGARRAARRRGAIDLDEVAEVYREHFDNHPVEAVASALERRASSGRQLHPASSRHASKSPPTTQGRKRA